MTINVYRWRVVLEQGSWKMRKGTELRWMMSEAEATSWLSNNPDTVIEMTPESLVTRADQRASILTVTEHEGLSSRFQKEWLW